MKATIALLIAAGLVAIVFVWAGSAEQPEAWDPPAAPPPMSAEVGSLELAVEPSHARIDTPVRISVRGAVPGADVILRAGTLDANGKRFDAWARFTADDAGAVDTRIAGPTDGSYRSVDGSGLLWSMRSEDADPYEFPDPVETRIRITAETRQGIVETTLTRTNPARAIAMREVRSDGVDAQYWLPSGGSTRLAAIIRLHGSEGEFSAISSALLADEGFAVLDLRYIDPSGIPEIVEIPIETVTDALDWLGRDARIDPARVGVYGASKGAELALVAAAYDTRIRAVAAWSPASVTFAGISIGSFSPGSSWSWQGRPLEHAPFWIDGLGVLRHVVRVLFRRVSLRHLYARALDRAPKDARIPVERISGAVLLLAGRDDRMWPAARMADVLDGRLRAAGHANHETILYDNAGHRMRYAVWPDLHAPSRFVGGGTPEANHAAGRAGWKSIRDFFERELRAADVPGGPSQATGASTRLDAPGGLENR